MKMVKITTMLAGLTIVTATARGAHMWEDPGTWWGNHFVYKVDVPRYTGYELSFDAFGNYQAEEDNLSEIFETDITHGIWGGGAGLNYFFTRYIGLGADASVLDNRGTFIDQFNGSLLLRLPIGNSGWAPYIFGGGGKATDPEWEWLLHGGVGFEYRWNPTTGVFVDGRYIWADETFDRLSLRAGLRFVF